MAGVAMLRPRLARRDALEAQQQVGGLALPDHFDKSTPWNCRKPSGAATSDEDQGAAFPLSRPAAASSNTQVELDRAPRPQNSNDVGIIERLGDFGAETRTRVNAEIPPNQMSPVFERPSNLGRSLSVFSCVAKENLRRRPLLAFIVRYAVKRCKRVSQLAKPTPNCVYLISAFHLFPTSNSTAGADFQGTDEASVEDRALKTMKRRAWLMMPLLFGCVIVPSAQAALSGSWGGPHVGLVLGKSGGQIDYDCAAGTIGPIIPRIDGTFELQDLIRPQQEGRTEWGQVRPTYRTHFTGRVRGGGMTLTGNVENGVLLGPFELRRGADPIIFRCL